MWNPIIYLKKWNEEVGKRRCMWLPIRLLNCFGIWDTDHLKWTKYFYKTTNVSIMTNILLVSFCMPMALIKYDLNLLDFSETLSWWTIFVAVAVTCATFFYRMEDILGLVNDLYAMQTPDQLIDEKQKIIRNTSQMITNIMSYGSIMIIGPILGIVLPFMVWPDLYEKRIFLYRLWLPIDHKFTTNYEILFTYLSYNGAIVTAIAVFAYLFILGILIHIVAQFKILNIKFRNIRAQAIYNLGNKLGEQYHHHIVQVEKKICTNVHQKEMSKKVMTALEEYEFNPHLRERRLKKEMERIVRDCIIHHQALIRWMNEFESIFAVMISFELATILLACAIVTILAVKLDTLEVKALLISAICFAGTANLFVRIMLIELISSEGEYIRDAAYESDWIEATPSFKKSIGIIISRSNVPIEINGLGCIPVTFVTYQQMMKTALSFYQFLAKSELRQ